MNEVTMNEVKEIVENVEENRIVTVWFQGQENEEHTKQCKKEQEEK